MASLDQRTNAEKIEILLSCERNGWDATEGARRHGVARTTLLGWMANKHKLFSSEADPTAKRAAPPGMAPPTLQYEAGIVERIKEKVANGQVVCRGDVVADAELTIPGFAERKPEAQSSWTTRFIGRHKLRTFISRRLKTTNMTTANVNEPPNKKLKLQVSTLAEKPKSADKSTLAEKPKSTAKSTLAENPKSTAKSTLAENPKSTAKSTLAEKPKPAVKSTLAENPTPAVKSTLAEKPKSAVKSTLAEKPKPAARSTLAEKPKSAVKSTLAEKSTPAAKSTLAETPEVVSLLDDDSGNAGVPFDFGDVWDISQSDIVCQTQSPCFVVGKPSMCLLVTADDVQTIKDQNWLNDVIMSYYIRVHLPQHGRTFVMDANVFGHIYNSFVQVERNIGLAHKRCCGITATFPYEKYDHVILPICMGNHWTFAIVQNPVGTTQNLRRCLVHVDSKGISSIEAIKKIVGGYFNAELQSKYPDNAAPAFVVRGVRTSPTQMNHDDCGVFVLYFIKRTIEAFQTGNTLLLSDIKKICTSPRSARFNAKMMRKEILEQLTQTHT